jgi:hypothetical protein
VAVLSRLRPPPSRSRLPSTALRAGHEIATIGEQVYSSTHPNGDSFPLLIFFLCNAYRHLDVRKVAFAGAWDEFVECIVGQ